MPYRYDKLRGRIIEKCGSQAKFADKIGLSQNSVSRKLNCDVGFSQTDMLNWATIVTGKDVFTKRANADPRYKGKKAGIIVIKKDGAVEEREGTMVLPNETIVGGWAKIFIDGKEDEYQSVGFDEYAGRKKDGSLNSQWAKKPATMIRKVAVVQALREAFPDRFQGLYAQEEFQNVSDVKLDTEKVVADEIKENANSVDFDEDNIIDVEPTDTADK